MSSRRKSEMPESDSDGEITISTERKKMLSDVEQRRLLILIKTEPRLWDHSDSHYKKATAKDRKKIWKTYDDMFCVEDGHCESFFNNAKLERRRSMKGIANTKSGSGGVNKMAKMKFDEELSFLDKVTTEKTISSLPSSSRSTIPSSASIDIVEEVEDNESIRGFPSVKKERSEGTLRYVTMDGICDEDGSLTVKARKRRADRLSKALEEERKTDQQIESLIQSIVKESDSPSKKTRSHYEDIHDRIGSFLDSLPSTKRYRAIGELHQMMNSIEDKFSNQPSNPPLPSHFHNPHLVNPPPTYYTPYVPPFHLPQPPPPQSHTAPNYDPNSTSAISQVTQLWQNQ